MASGLFQQERREQIIALLAQRGRVSVTDLSEQFGVRLARFHGLDPGPLIPARSRESSLHRPLDCTLDCSRARTLLRTPLPGVDEVLGRLATDEGRGGWILSIACD